MSGDTPLLDVRGLRVHFPVRRGLFGGVPRGVNRVVHAVDDVSLAIAPGETLGLVGESGCGKTTLGRAILRLVAASAGTVRFDGRDVLGASGAELLALRRQMQVVFQDPWSSLDPRMSAGAIVAEGLEIHRLARGEEKRRRVAELLELVGLPADAASKLPHEFSGGQRQRIGIARALAVDPRFVVCDEAVSALDVSVQAQIVNLLLDLRERRGLSYLFISHDLAVVRAISDRVAVMHLGEIIESGPADAVFSQPRHPYTQALLAAALLPPGPAPEGKASAGSATGLPRLALQGEPPSPIAPPPGCRFHPRCPYVRPECRVDPPPERPAGERHTYRCVL